MRARRLLRRLLASGALAAQPAPAQEPGAVRETAEVTLVEVPVRVVDRDGKPVRGLTATDFTLSDDGRPQTIVGFDAIDLAEKVDGRGPDPCSPGRAPPLPDPLRLLVLAAEGDPRGAQGRAGVRAVGAWRAAIWLRWRRTPSSRACGCW